MHDDEVPLQAEAGARAVAPAVAVRVPVAVGDGALVLHPGVRHFDQFVPVLVPRIRTEPVLETPEHRGGLDELPLRGVEVIAEGPEVEREWSVLSLEQVTVVLVAPRADGDGVVVDRVDHEPLVGRRAVRVVRDAAQPPVGDVDQRIGHGERHALAVGLVRLRVLVGPPHARTHALIGRDDPRAAQAVRGPGEAALPGRPLCHPRLAVVIDRDRATVARPLAGRQVREIGVSFPAEHHRPPVLLHTVDLERRHQVDLQFAARRENPVGDAVVSADTAVRGMNGHVEVVEHDVPPRERAPQRIGAGEESAGLGRDGSDLGERERSAEERSQQRHSALTRARRRQIQLTSAASAIAPATTVLVRPIQCSAICQLAPRK